MYNKEELTKYIFGNTKTIDVLDEFEGLDEKHIVYQRLIIGNSFRGVTRKGVAYNYKLVVERGKDKEYIGDITFTEFKQKKTGKLEQFVREQLTDEVIRNYKGKNKIFYFNKPFHLRAQNSLNRTGYGWEWDWSYGVGDYTEGTFYGETTDYIFAGVYID